MKMICLLVLLFAINYCESWSPVGNRLKSKWTSSVNSSKVWPEYPRPQLVRQSWVNLNGLWEYSITPIASNEPNKYDGQILVPFPVESSLSGVQKTVNQNQALWYKRHFTADIGPNQLLILHFDAVDYKSLVFINGHPMEEHKGGYNRFSFDITKFLNGNKENTLVLKVTDSTGNAQPRGKQESHPSGNWWYTFYTPTTGIWQTVWLEKVPKTYIKSLRITPDIDSDSVEITVNTNEPIDHSEIQIIDKTGKVVAVNEKASVNSQNKIKIASPRLWSTTNPYLYDIHVKAGIDSVSSYVGLRKIEIKKDSKGIDRFFLNHKPIFMFGPLDQGFWPDGVYTPPNEDAIVYDIEMTHKFGFNTIRKHVKIESDRWYYATDRMGLLVWQDFPASMEGVKDNKRTTAEAQQIELEMERMVTQLHNHPSIIMWVLFNEGWGQYDSQRIVSLFRKWDSSRLINEASGWTDHGFSNIEDHHFYPNPKDFGLKPNRVVVIGPKDPHHLQKFFTDCLATVRAHAIFGLGAAIYTQITDLEAEINGLLTYDRSVIKVEDVNQMKKHVDKLYPSQSVANIILPTGHESNSQEWFYTTKDPVGNWTQMAYDSSGWPKGNAGFGAYGTPEIAIHTEWKTSDIWLRKVFEINGQKLPKHPVLHIFYDDIAEVHINGIEVHQNEFDPFQTAYSAHDIDPKLLKVGTNVIAIHCHQLTGGQGIDAGIIDVTYD